MYKKKLHFILFFLTLLTFRIILSAQTTNGASSSTKNSRGIDVVNGPEVVFKPDSAGFGKESRWKKSLKASLNLNQASFSGNWKGGGVNSIALGGLVEGKLTRETPRTAFANEIQLLYGIVKNAGQLLKKSNDRIFLESKFSYKLSERWRAFASVSFLSQFDLGFRFDKDKMENETRTKISRFMSPGYLTEALGFEYKPVPYFFLNIGALAVRQTFVLDTTIVQAEPTNYGVPPGEQVRNEVAFQLIAGFDKEILKNVSLSTRLQIFANYADLRHIDTRWDAALTAKINNFLSTNLTGSFIYDDDMDTRPQYSQALSLGLLYVFDQQ